MLRRRCHALLWWRRHPLLWRWRSPVGRWPALEGVLPRLGIAGPGRHLPRTRRRCLLVLRTQRFPLRCRQRLLERRPDRRRRWRHARRRWRRWRRPRRRRGRLGRRRRRLRLGRRRPGLLPFPLLPLLPLLLVLGLGLRLGDLNEPRVCDHDRCRGTAQDGNDKCGETAVATDYHALTPFRCGAGRITNRQDALAGLTLRPRSHHEVSTLCGSSEARVALSFCTGMLQRITAIGQKWAWTASKSSKWHRATASRR